MPTSLDSFQRKFSKLVEDGRASGHLKVASIHKEELKDVSEEKEQHEYDMTRYTGMMTKGLDEVGRKLHHVYFHFFTQLIYIVVL